MKKDKRKIKMTFEVIEPFDMLIDDETLKKKYKGDIHKVAKFLYKEEGIWWASEMKLIKTEIIN